MRYSELCRVYEELQAEPSRLKKTEILSNFIKKIEKPEHIYLLQGRIFPDYDERETGISQQLTIKALSKASGENIDKIIKRFRHLGDLGLVAEEIMKGKKQSTLSSKHLDISKVLDNLQKLPDLEGKGTVEKKLALITELLNSASPTEAKYLTRTLLADLRVGVSTGTIRDAIVQAFLEKNKENTEKVQNAYDMSTDFARVIEVAKNNRFNIHISPGKPIKVMLALKAENIKDGFERAGKRAAFEYKYDGFRMLVTGENGKINIFTRRLDNVTKQFPDVVKYIKERVKAKSFMLDGEAVGFNPKTKHYQPFQAISQRIKRKYDIEKLEKELPVELNVFDLVYLEGKSLLNEPFIERRKLLEKIIKPEKYKIVLAKQLITESEAEAEKFYKEALKDNQEGVMIKNLNAPYKPGARVGYMLKLKPESRELDLVITGAEYGNGKRAGWLTSYDVSCQANGKFLEVGKVSTGLKEKESQGLSFLELSKKLKPLITKEEGKHVQVKPKIVVTVIFQNIQRSPTYTSGFALRFPRITVLRPEEDKPLEDIATLKDIEDDYAKESKWRIG